MDRTAIYETGGETEREHHFPYSKRNSRAGILPHDAISPVRLTYQGRVRQPGAALHFLQGGRAMEMDNFSKRADQSAEQPKVVYIGGCKVTVRYSGQKNPSAVKRIKDTLIAGATAGKS